MNCVSDSSLLALDIYLILAFVVVSMLGIALGWNLRRNEEKSEEE